ncbi:hypothetical protein ACQ33O_09360 [Ferruginibacter sp. SUN002]|uniref:hypothetical protein n=1 Tax=Ferruginibacter sp. SUN002 TaxID=2937789 RepID=UPI003D36A2AD
MLLSSTYAQTETDSSANALSYLPKTIMIDPQKFLGIWESQDSSKHQIQFYFNKKRFYLGSISDSSLVYNSFEFFRQDSSSMVSNSGVIIKWPPDNCYVNPIDENNIEIKYGYFGSPATSIKYRRIQNKAVW